MIEHPVTNNSHVISGPCSKVKITARAAADESLSYPIAVFAFTESGDLQTSQTLNSADDALALELPVGHPFKLVAVSGNTETYNIPTAPKYSDVITLKPSVQIAQDYPLQMAFADITPSNNDANVVMGMNYQQAALNIALSNIPDECTAINVAISNATPSISFDGTTGSAQTATFALTKNNEGVWRTASDVYVIPTQATTTTFTITCTFPEGDNITSATYQNKLTAGTPYNIYGTFDKGTIEVAGSITSPMWGTPVNLSFLFGTTSSVEITEGISNNPNNNQNGGDEDNPGIANVTSLPAIGTLYDGHFIVGITDSEGESASSDASAPGVYNLILMSLEDWGDLTSENNTSSPTTAHDIADEYAEGSLSNWTIPTEAEADILYYYFTGNKNVNSTLTNAGASPIVLTIGGNNANAKYLCNNATKSFSFVNGTFSVASATASNFKLRLVNTIKVRLQ